MICFPTSPPEGADTLQWAHPGAAPHRPGPALHRRHPRRVLHRLPRAPPPADHPNATKGPRTQACPFLQHRWVMLEIVEEKQEFFFFFLRDFIFKNLKKLKNWHTNKIFDLSIGLNYWVIKNVAGVKKSAFWYSLSRWWVLITLGWTFRALG